MVDWETTRECNYENLCCKFLYSLWQFPLSISHVQWKGMTALMEASEGGYLDVVKEVLRAQAGVDLQDEVCCLYLQLTL